MEVLADADAIGGFVILALVVGGFFALGVLVTDARARIRALEDDEQVRHRQAHLRHKHPHSHQEE